MAWIPQSINPHMIGVMPGDAKSEAADLHWAMMLVAEHPDAGAAGSGGLCAWQISGRRGLAHLRQGSGASAQARFGAVSFIHRFGASLNRHVHYDENHPGSRAPRALSGAQIRSRPLGHCGVIEGVLKPLEDADDVPQSARLRPAVELTPEALAAITKQVRVRGRQRFARSGLIEADDVRDGPCPLGRLAPRIGPRSRACGEHLAHRLGPGPEHDFRQPPRCPGRVR
jgi:hypothetical protein